jgi:hypothetical protein
VFWMTLPHPFGRCACDAARSCSRAINSASRCPAPGLMCALRERAVGALEARADAAKADVILVVALNRTRLQTRLPMVLAKAPPTAILWLGLSQAHLPPCHGSEPRRRPLACAALWPGDGKPDRDR